MDVDKLIKKKQRAKRDGNLQQMVKIVKDLGDLYFETGRMDDALQEYLEQLEVCNVLADKLNIAIAHRMIGEVYTALGDYEQAFIHQNLYLEGVQKTKNLLEEQRAYATLGRTHFCHAESLSKNSGKKREALSDAKKAYTKSIHLCIELEDKEIERKELLTMRARLLLNLGLVLEAQGDYEQAIDLIGKAAILCKDGNLQEDFHRTQIALASVHEQQSNFARSLVHLDNAINIENIFLKAEAQLAKAQLLLQMEKWQESRNILVSLYVNQGLNPNLRSNVEKCLRIVVTIQETERSLETETDAEMKLKCYEKLGDAAAAACCFEKAIDYYRKMLHWAEESSSATYIGAALISLAQTLKDTGRYAEALQFARRELRLNAEPGEICRSALFLVDLLIESDAPEDDIFEIYNLALNNAKMDNSMLPIVIKEFSNYVEKTGNIEKANQLRETANIPTGSQKSNSEAESEEEIGIDICLDDLSDVEELKSIGIRRTDRQRPKRTIVKRNEKGETQLHVACINGNIQVVEKLLTAEHPVNLRDHAGWSPLHEAANHGHVEIAKLLLEHNANINDPGGSMCSGVTPLHDAASCGHLSMMRLLIEHGANVVLRTRDGETVLDCLKQWRNRVDLSSEEQVDYDDIVRKLSAVIPENVSKRDKSQIKLIKAESELEVHNEDVQRISIEEDYKRTIANLKHRESRIGALSAKKCAVVGPLLNSEEVLVDDWLEDDIGTAEGIKEKSKEKRKNTDVFNEKRKAIENFEKERKSRNFENTAKRQKLSDSCEVNVEEEEILFKRDKPKIKRKQTSLLSIGFTRNTPTRSPTTSPVPPSFLFESVETTRIENITLNIHLNRTVFKISVQFSKDGAELKEKILSDVKQNLYNESGCQSQLELQTMDGSLLLPENISVILRNGVKDIKCEILELMVPPIVQRYNTLCKTYNIEPREPISRCLKSCENTSVLRTKLEEIAKQEITCMLKVIQFQQNIQVLHFTGGEMYKHGELLNECMMNLSNLQELCLASCDISFHCLSKFESFPPCLKVLDLSFNPLGKHSHDKLGELLTPLRQLQTLNVRCCMLESFQALLKSENLIDLDISWNKLSLGEFFPFSQRQLLNLNVSHSVSLNVTNLKFAFCFASMESVELTSCNLFDVDVEMILSDTPNLVKIIVSGNKELTSLSARRLLAHKPTLKNIDMVGCSVITEYPDCETLIESPENCKFVATMDRKVSQFWLALWRGKGVMETLSTDTIIFKPIIKMKN